MNKRKAWSFLVLFLCATIVGVYLARNPWEVFRDERQRTDDAVKEMNRLEKDRASLTREKAEYESSVGRERLARERGYVKPGEVPAGESATAKE